MTPRKKILFVITKSVWGGAQRYVYDLATNLPRERFEPVVAAGGNGPLHAKLRAAGIRSIMVPGLERDIHPRSEGNSFFSLLKIFLDEDPDVIHLNSTKAGGLGGLAGFFFKIIRRRFHTKILYTVHGWAFHEDRFLGTRALIFLLVWLSSLFHDQTIVINTSDQQSARKFIPSRKIVRVFNGIGTIDFLSREEARSVWEEKAGVRFNPQTVVIGVIAELNRNKGLSCLVGAVNLLKTRFPHSQVRIVVAGEGADRKLLQQQIELRKLRGTISLVGFLPDAAQYLKGLDIFVLPSSKEGLPYVVLEAMTAELPVIATRVGGIPDLVAHRRTGILIPAKDSESLSRALHDLLENPRLRARLGKTASARLKTKFHLRDMIRKTSALYL